MESFFLDRRQMGETNWEGKVQTHSLSVWIKFSCTLSYQQCKAYFEKNAADYEDDYEIILKDIDDVDKFIKFLKTLFVCRGGQTMNCGTIRWEIFCMNCKKRFQRKKSN